MTDDPATFGTVLRQLRMSAALTQEELANRAGLSLRGISDLERGVRRAPHLSTVGMLADALALSPEDRQALLAAARPGDLSEPQAAAPGGYASLPRPLTSMIGRERELSLLVALLGNADTRLLTLTGAGGTGKTRLALEAGARLRRAFADGVVFVDLTPLRDAALVMPTIASALGVRERPGQPLRATLCRALAARQVLLLIDNCEHVLAAAPEIAALLTICPSLTVLATSRAALRVRGEREVSLSPLRLPSADRLFSVEDLTEVPAIALFVERAVANCPSFALTGENADEIATICRHLDGLPLAIELAAARIRVLSPAALLARLGHRLPLLSDGSRDLPQRQRTMRDAIAWSYDLLSPEEQAIFRRLAVFVGGCTLEAIEAVCTGPEVDVLKGVTALVDQSLLQRVEPVGSSPRFGMLETVREYALERLAASGETALLRARHAAYFAALAERGVAGSYASTTSAAAREFALERPNVRAALAWEAEQGSNDLLLRLAAAGWWYWEPAEGYRTLERALAATPASASRRGERALILAAMGEMAAWLGYGVRTIELLEESLALAREADDPEATALAQLWLASVLAGQWDLDRAQALATEALARCQVMTGPGRPRLGDTLYVLGYIAALRGDQTTAEARFGEALGLARALGAELFAAVVLEALGTCAREQGNPRQAAKLFAESLTMVGAGEYPLLVINCVKSLGAVAAAMGRPGQAARLFGAAEALGERHGLVLEPAERLRLERAIAPARAGLPAGDFVAAWADGRALPMAQAIVEALALADEVSAPQASDPGAHRGRPPQADRRRPSRPRDRRRAHPQTPA